MANIRVRSTDGLDTDNGSTWALAKATISGALAIAAAGDTIWVSQAHAETSASSVTLTSPGTAALPCKIMCVNDGADPPTATATGASVTTTGTTNIAFGAGHAIWERLTFNVGSGSGTGNFNLTTSPQGHVFESCAINLVNTATASVINLGAPSSTVQQYARLNNCTYSFGNINQNFVMGRMKTEIFGGSMAATGSIPTELFNGNINVGGVIEATGVDMSALGSGKAIVAINTGAPWALYKFMDCKLGASVSLTSGTPVGPGGPEVWFFNCDSGDVHYDFAGRSYEGNIDAETTIVMTGGSSDGVTTYSTKMSPSANVSVIRPLYSQWIYGPYITSLGSSKTATVEIVCDNASNLTDAEVWLEMTYQGTSGFPLATYASDRVATMLATPVAQTTSSVTWTTTGLSAPKKQKLQITFTPQEVGVVMGRVAVAKVSPAVVYVDTQITVT